MKIRINGTEIGNWTTLTVGRHFLDLCGTFQFETSADNTGVYLPLKTQQKCEIIVENTTFLTGYIEKLTISGSSQSTRFIVEGRDQTCDIVDSTVPYDFLEQYKNVTTVKEVAQTIVNKLGLENTVKVLTTVTLPDLSPGTYINSFIGERAYDLLQRYAKLSNVYTVTDGLGNIVFTRVASNFNSDLIDTPLINWYNDPSNNVLNFEYSLDTTQLYHLYRAYSQIGLKFVSDASQLNGGETVVGNAIDESIRPSRQWVFIDDIAVDEQSAPDRAIWEKNYRQSKFEAYTCTVQGHTIPNTLKIWTPNTLVIVFDRSASLAGKIFLIDSVSFKESVDNGKTTRLHCVNPLSYTLQLQENYYSSRARTGGNFFDANQL
jgi:prophage tail gpP-like protein